MSDLDRTVGTTDVSGSTGPATNSVVTDGSTKDAASPEPGTPEADIADAPSSKSDPADSATNESDAADAGTSKSDPADSATKESDAADAGTSKSDPADSGTNESDAAEPPTPLSPSEVWRLSAVAGVQMELPSSNPEIVIHESQHPWRELRIPVGMAEGTAIAYAFRGIPTPRPLTHELVTEILERHGVSVEAVRITVRRGQLFHAELDTMGPRGRQVVPCRPSDAIALLLRQHMPTPLLVAEWVFTDTGADHGSAH